MLRHTDQLYIVMVCLTLVGYCMMFWLQTVKEVFLIEHVPVGVKVGWVLLVLLDVLVELHTCKLVEDKEIVSLNRIR